MLTTLILELTQQFFFKFLINFEYQQCYLIFINFVIKQTILNLFMLIVYYYYFNNIIFKVKF